VSDNPHAPPDRCPACGWPRAELILVSSHHTSAGVVRYLRCVCGAWSIDLTEPDGIAATEVATIH
jgi:hypothetical protein